MPTPLINFRFPESTLAEIDAICRHLASEGHGETRADAVRWAVHQTFLRIRGREKKSEKKANSP